MSIKTDNTQTLANALAEIERLRGRVSELESSLTEVIGHYEDSMDYPIVQRAHKALSGKAGAWLLRKEADAVEAVAKELEQSDRYGKKEFRRGMATSYGYATGYAQRLRNEADELENNNEQNN